MDAKQNSSTRQAPREKVLLGDPPTHNMPVVLDLLYTATDRACFLSALFCLELLATLHSQREFQAVRRRVDQLVNSALLAERPDGVFAALHHMLKEVCPKGRFVLFAVISCLIQ